MVGTERRPLWKIALWMFVAVLTLFIAAGLYYIASEGGGSLPVIGQAPNFSATNINGQTVQMSQLNGKVRLVTWFYTHCPDECPLTAFQMQKVQNQLEQDGTFPNQTAFLSISFDPVRDTLPVIQQWSTHFHPNYKGWYFLRPAAEHLPAMLAGWGIQTKSTNADQIEHIIRTDLVDGSGNIRRSYNTADLNVDQVVSDIRNVLSKRNWTTRWMS